MMILITVDLVFGMLIPNVTSEPILTTSALLNCPVEYSIKRLIFQHFAVPK